MINEQLGHSFVDKSLSACKCTRLNFAYKSEILFDKNIYIAYCKASDNQLVPE